MTLRYLLDTNIMVFVLRRSKPALLSRLIEESDRIAVSSITVSELAYGVERSADPAANRRATEQVLALVKVLPFDTAAAQHAGEIRAGLASSGTPIGGYDLLIAGHARAAGLIVVTDNDREFSCVPGLQVEDWAG